MGEDGIAVATARVNALVGLALDELPDSSVMVFDTDLRFVLCRGGALAVNDVVPEQLEGLLAADALAPARWAFYQPMYAAALRGEASSLEVDSPDGARRYAIRVGPLADGSGRILGGVALATDVTDPPPRRAGAGRQRGAVPVGDVQRGRGHGAVRAGWAVCGGQRRDVPDAGVHA